MMDWRQGLQLVPPRPDLPDVVAVGGDLNPQRVLDAYRNGVFPWPHAPLPLLWFSPEHRVVLQPRRVHLSRSLRRAMRRNPYVVTADQACRDVIWACARTPRPGQEGSWITDEMVACYIRLHHMGVVHSVEAWRDDELVGGLYGVCIGDLFCGESMFHRRPDAAKICLATLLAHFVRWGVELVDCQMHTPHIDRFGTASWPRDRFELTVRRLTTRPTRTSPWRLDLDSAAAQEVLCRVSST